MKKKTLIIIGVILITLVVVPIILFGFIISNIKFSGTLFDNKKESYDEKIIKVLKNQKIIAKEDKYVNSYITVGLFGIEDEEYIYETATGTYYIIDVWEGKYNAPGEYLGYNYEKNEVFYTTTIQFCNYDSSLDSGDKDICERIGEEQELIIYYEKGKAIIQQAKDANNN